MLRSRRLKKDDVALIVAKGDVPIAHEVGHSHILIGGEARHLSASEDVPYNGSASRVIADRQSS